MSSTVVTTRNTQPNTTVLARLAERWRGAGVFLACMDRDGNLLWHDSQMPRVLALCFTADNSIAQQVRKLPDSAGAHVSIVAPLPGFRIELAPGARGGGNCRRGWRWWRGRRTCRRGAKRLRGWQARFRWMRRR